MAKELVKIVVAGAAGKMGRTILGLALKDPTIKIVGAFESDSSYIGRDAGELIGEKPIHVPISSDVKNCVSAGDVLIDFTHPSAASAHLKTALDKGAKLVIGTTGLSETLISEIKKASAKIGIVQSPNMSLGVNLLFELAKMTASILDESYDIEIVEAHHAQKKDAPSGTALELLRQIMNARKTAESNAVYGRKGETGARRKGTIGVHAVRGGDVVGDHTVSFLTEGERIELIHRASSRAAFAKGALLAAKFIAKQKSGFYNMQQVLGLV